MAGVFTGHRADMVSGVEEAGEQTQLALQPDVMLVLSLQVWQLLQQLLLQLPAHLQLLISHLSECKLFISPGHAMLSGQCDAHHIVEEACHPIGQAMEYAVTCVHGRIIEAGMGHGQTP